MASLLALSLELERQPHKVQSGFARPVSSSTQSTNSLQGLSVLIVEDEYDIARECATVLAMQGASVIGPASDLPSAQSCIAEQRPDCVVLDVNLHGKLAFDFADELQRRGIPTIFMSGYDRSKLPPRLRDAPFLEKPVDTELLIRTIGILTAGKRP